MEHWELVARESIRDRIARWNANGDAGRFDQMVAVLAPDVVFDAAGVGVMSGRDTVLAYLRGMHTEHPVEDAGRPSYIRHYTSTTQIDVVDRTSARARSYYVVLGPAGLDHWGRYTDEFGLVEGEWLITRRKITNDGAVPSGWAASFTGEARS